MLRCTAKKKNGRHNVYISGRMTLPYIHVLLKLLRKVCDESEEIVLHMHKVTEVDLPGLQLLCSAQKSLKTDGKKMSIADGYPEVLVRVIKDTGYIYSPIYTVQDKGGRDND